MEPMCLRRSQRAHFHSNPAYEIGKTDYPSEICETLCLARCLQPPLCCFLCLKADKKQRELSQFPLGFSYSPFWHHKWLIARTLLSGRHSEKKNKNKVRIFLAFLERLACKSEILQNNSKLFTLTFNIVFTFKSQLNWRSRKDTQRNQVNFF